MPSSSRIVVDRADIKTSIHRRNLDEELCKDNNFDESTYIKFCLFPTLVPTSTSSTKRMSTYGP